MNRAIRRYVILTLVLLGSVAYAGPKQKIAVLGIEAVIGANGQIDKADVDFAKDLTKELRSRVNNSTQYELTKDQRELSDEKLMNNCGAEHPSCMAPIGASMGAEVMLFGKVENAKGGYKVSLKLVSVAKKQQIASDPNAFIAAGDTRGANLANWVREHYRKLTGEGSEGQLVIVAGSGGGSVYVNGELKDTLKGGTAKLTLPEGRYRIGVEADGFKLFEQEGVTISSDKPVELQPKLTKKDEGGGEVKDPGNGTTTGTEPVIDRTGSVSGKKNKTMFKVAAAVGLGGAGVGAIFLGYSYFKIRDYDSATVAPGTQWDPKNGDPRGTGSVGDGDCGEGNFVGGNASSVQGKFDAACSAKSRMKWLVPVTAGLAVIGAGALIYVLVSKDEESPPPGTAGRRAKKKNFVVTPVVTPDGTGATLRFDW